MKNTDLTTKVAIISILYNSDSLLDEFFFSISIQKKIDISIFLLDNNTNENTKQLIHILSKKHDLKSVHYIETKENKGFAEGNNIVLKDVLKMDFDYFLLSNNDISFNQEDLIYRLKNKCEEYKIVTPRILYSGTNNIWFSGGYINKYKGLNIHENEFKDTRLIENIEKTLEFAPACFLMIHRDVFEKIGLFDKKYFVYWEDVDFCVRAIKKGFKIMLIPDLLIEHKVSITTGGRASLFSTYYFLRNRLYFIRKHFKGIYKISSLIYTYFTSSIKIMIYDFKRKKIILKAIKDSNKM